LQILLGNLSPEVWQRIVDQLIAFDYDERFGIMPRSKRAVSWLSRTCWELTRTLRHLLYSPLLLHSSSDVLFLQNILQSSLSKSLRLYILDLKFRYEDCFFDFIALLPLTPSLRRLEYGLNQDFKCPIEIRPHLSCIQSLQKLDLRYVTFLSSSAFLRIVGAIPSLEELLLNYVNWQSSGTFDQLPDCKAAFTNLRVVKCWSLECPFWPVTWMLAAPATGHAYRRHRVVDRDPNPQIAPPDISVLVSTVKMVLNHVDDESSDFVLMECPDNSMIPFCVSEYWNFYEANVPHYRFIRAVYRDERMSTVLSTQALWNRSLPLDLRVRYLTESGRGSAIHIDHARL
jgi:hypothetical protein